MSKRKFQVAWETEVTIEIDDSVINAVDDEWRLVFYDLNTPEEIAIMLAMNINAGARLSQLDGWADQTDDKARITEEDTYYEEAKELKE